MKKIFSTLQGNPIYKKYEMYLAPVVVAAVLIVLILTVIVPNFFQYFEVNTKINEANDKLAFYRTKGNILQSIKKEEYQKSFSSSFALLPNDKEAPAAISQVYYLVNSSGMNIQNISFGDGGGGADGKSFRVNLEMTGSLSNLTSFILKIKETPRVMFINSLEVSSQGGSGDLYTTMIIDAYYEPLTAGAVNLDQQVVLPSEKDLEILAKLKNTSFPLVSDEVNYSGAKGKENPFQ